MPRQDPAVVEIKSQIEYDMDNHPTFAERATLLKETAFQLKKAAESVMEEAQRMQAARVRFSERQNRGASRVQSR